MKVTITYDDTLYQLVPREATREMEIAGKHTLKGAADLVESMQAVCVWQSMLSAAPTPPAQPAERMPLTKDDVVKDAERYRWLEQQFVQRTAYDVYGKGGHWRAGVFSDDSRQDFRAAIDAAMLKEGK